MANADADRLKDYLALITRKHGGIEPIKNMLDERAKAGAGSGLESMSDANDDFKLAVSGLEAVELAASRQKANSMASRRSSFRICAPPSTSSTIHSR